MVGEGKDFEEMGLFQTAVSGDGESRRRWSLSFSSMVMAESGSCSVEEE